MIGSRVVDEEKAQTQDRSAQPQLLGITFENEGASEQVLLRDQDRRAYVEAYL